MKSIVIIDAQGGGLGKTLVEKLLQENVNAQIIAVGTNVIATTVMKKAGAKSSATGENAIMFNAKKADIIIGGIGIISANGMLGEITPKMAEAISSSEAIKVLIPFGKCNIKVPGIEKYSLSQMIDMAIVQVKALVNDDNEK